MAKKKQRGLRKTREGVVISDRMDKTVVVLVERLMAHPLYGRVIRRRRKYMAHDENNECRVGDVVRIIECRPLSKRKSWRVLEVLRRESATISPAEALEESVEVTEEIEEIEEEIEQTAQQQASHESGPGDDSSAAEPAAESADEQSSEDQSDQEQ